MTILINIIVTGIVTVASVFGVVNFVSLDTLGFSNDPQLGASTTDLQTSDNLTDFPTLYNANLLAINTELALMSGTTTNTTLTTVANLVTVGALSSGSLASGFTAVTVPLGGTGSTTLSANQVLLGNGTTQLKVVNGLGASGNCLLSQGAGLPPNWSGSCVDTTANFSWTGLHNFARATSTRLSVIDTLYIGGNATTTIQGETTATSTFSGGVQLTNVDVSGIFSGLSIVATSSAKTDCGTSGGDACSHSITCPSGYHEAISGGFTHASGDAYVKQNYRSASTTWTVQIVNELAVDPNPLTVYAVCLKN